MLSKSLFRKKKFFSLLLVRRYATIGVREFKKFTFLFFEDLRRTESVMSVCLYTCVYFLKKKFIEIYIMALDLQI